MFLESCKQTVNRLTVLFLVSLLTSCATTDSRLFKLRFVDDQTRRGIPLVEIISTNGVQYVSDSAGSVAIDPQDFAWETVYFFVRSHGYELEAGDKHDFRGVRIKPVAGGRKTVALQRINIAERLYRITGEGIYHDSQLLDGSAPLSYPVATRGGVFGQDSVVNAVYDDQLYWFWGDTRRADAPLGNFEVSGAVSSLRWTAENNPGDGINLNYFVSEDGFARAMCPIEGDGPVWINGLMVFEEDGQEHMLAHYSRMKDLETRLEQGIVAWNDEAKIFEKQVDFPINTPLHPRGHPLKLERDGQTWYYFGNAFPNVRVRTTQHDILDPTRYQAYTCLTQGSRWQDDNPPLDRDQGGQLNCTWKEDTDLINEKRWHSLLASGLVKPEEKRWPLIDAETGEPITPSSGSIAWNQYRNRWILIVGQVYGRSFLGEVWYAEALDPMGPWSEARRIVTHDSYSFYNVKQHPYFASGPNLYFEGTYTKTFSASDQPTPRYDYNQIMYRLNLDDPRLPRMTEGARQLSRPPVVNSTE